MTQCKRCGADYLHWKNVEGKYTLEDDKGNSHQCVMAYDERSMSDSTFMLCEKCGCKISIKGLKIKILRIKEAIEKQTGNPQDFGNMNDFGIYAQCACVSCGNVRLMPDFEKKK